MNMVLRALVTIVLFSMVLFACSGGGGGSATPQAGQNSVATSVYSQAPLAACADGGITVNAGIDTNSNGVLDSSEVTSTQYVCNGAAGGNGTNGFTTLVSVTSEPAGTNCAEGGQKVSVGKDVNANNVLDVSEISSADDICNGPTGASGLNSLFLIEPEWGICSYGGQVITSGLDLDSNGVLDPGEVTSTSYACNGATGQNGAAGPGITWLDVTGPVQQASPNWGYLADSDAQVTITLPAAPAVGSIVQVSGIGGGGWKIAQKAGQSVVTPDIAGAPLVTGVQWIARESVRVWAAVASSSDGAKLVAVPAGLGGQIYTSADSGATWTARESIRQWAAVASSADGTKLVAGANGGFGFGQIYTSIDSGATWTARDLNRRWVSLASSADGAKLVAAVYLGRLYTSIDSGVTWTARDTNRWWNHVASSADGTKLAATVQDGQIYTSTDSGVSWTPRDTNRSWVALASSADGAKLAAADVNGSIYTSTDSGATWTPREARDQWRSIASSDDGTRLAAVDMGGYIYTSTDSGATWTARGSQKGWYCIASSSDGTKLFAAVYNGQLYTSTPVRSTTAGIAGSISGAQFDAIALQYAGNNVFTTLSHEGDLVVQ